MNYKGYILTETNDGVAIMTAGTNERPPVTWAVASDEDAAKTWVDERIASTTGA